MHHPHLICNSIIIHAFKKGPSDDMHMHPHGHSAAAHERIHIVPEALRACLHHELVVTTYEDLLHETTRFNRWLIERKVIEYRCDPLLPSNWYTRNFISHKTNCHAMRELYKKYYRNPDHTSESKKGCSYERFSRSFGPLKTSPGGETTLTETVKSFVEALCAKNLSFIR
ncbi:hypothetical protein CVS40_11906 [Lucilia cuprina]|nr:hypothetical protein CVS40_11906 [Lucilia cuprina]